MRNPNFNKPIVIQNFQFKVSDNLLDPALRKFAGQDVEIVKRDKYFPGIWSAWIVRAPDGQEFAAFENEIFGWPNE